MGCAGSTNTAVHPLAEGQDETASKLGSRGDSAVSKGTADSGVVMENKEVPVLPGAVPGHLHPQRSEFVRESGADRVTPGGLLQQDSAAQDRQKSSEILEELLNQGIIPVGQSREGNNGAGEAYSIMLDDRDVGRRRPPARLQSLKAQRVQSLPSKEEIDEKIRLAEERRKLREDELKTRLRTKSARVRIRAPISSTEEDKDTSLTPVESLQSPLTRDLTPAPLFHGQITDMAAEGGECVREAGSDDGEFKKGTLGAEMTKGVEKGGARGDDRGEGAVRVGEDGDVEEELNQVVQFLAATGELESDSSFQHAEDKEEIF